MSDEKKIVNNRKSRRAIGKALGQRTFQEFLRGSMRGARWQDMIESGHTAPVFQDYKEVSISPTSKVRKK